MDPKQVKVESYSFASVNIVVVCIRAIYIWSYPSLRTFNVHFSCYRLKFLLHFVDSWIRLRRLREELYKSRSALDEALVQLQGKQDEMLDRRLVKNLIVRQVLYKHTYYRLPDCADGRARRAFCLGDADGVGDQWHTRCLGRENLHMSSSSIIRSPSLSPAQLCWIKTRAVRLR